MNETKFKSQYGRSLFNHEINRGLSPINSDQDIYTANKMANAFVREKFNTAWQYRNNGNTEKALFEFGLALHTLQDSTSSSHADFQPWSGHETKYQEFQHVIKEMRQPNMDNQLYKITKDAYQWYKSGKLPKGDLFQR